MTPAEQKEQEKRVAQQEAKKESISRQKDVDKGKVIRK